MCRQRMMGEIRERGRQRCQLMMRNRFCGTKGGQAIYVFGRHNSVIVSTCCEASYESACTKNGLSPDAPPPFRGRMPPDRCTHLCAIKLFKPRIEAALTSGFANESSWRGSLPNVGSSSQRRVHALSHVVFQFACQAQMCTVVRQMWTATAPLRRTLRPRS